MQALWQACGVQLHLKAAPVVVQQQHRGRLDPVRCAAGRGAGGEGWWAWWWWGCAGRLGNRRHCCRCATVSSWPPCDLPLAPRPRPSAPLHFSSSCRQEDGGRRALCRSAHKAYNAIVGPNGLQAQNVRSPCRRTPCAPPPPGRPWCQPPHAAAETRPRCGSRQGGGMWRGGRHMDRRCLLPRCGEGTLVQRHPPLGNAPILYKAARCSSARQGRKLTGR